MMYLLLLQRNFFVNELSDQLEGVFEMGNQFTQQVMGSFGQLFMLHLAVIER